MLCPLGTAKKTCQGAESEKAVRETEKQLIEKGKMPKDAKPKAVRVNPGTIVVQARPTEGSGGKVLNRSPNSEWFFVIKDDPVINGGDVTHPQQGFENGAGGTGQPNVNFGFTGHGKQVFEGVTKKIAQRGQEAQLPGVPKTRRRTATSRSRSTASWKSRPVRSTTRSTRTGSTAEQRRPDHRRLHDQLRAGTGEELQIGALPIKLT